MNRRRVLATATGTLGAILLPGCAGLESDRDSPTPSPTTATPTPTYTRDPPSHEELSDEPDPDLPVDVENEREDALIFRLVVRRGSGETVHDATHEVPPGDYTDVYNLRAADPQGIKTFTVAAELDGRSDSVTVRTDACHGGVVVTIPAEGAISLTYSIC